MIMDTRTNSSQSFRLNKYGIFAVSLASAFSVNAYARETTENNPADSCIPIQMELNYSETLGTDKTYSFPAKKDFRVRYKKIAQSEWFKKTHYGMGIGEIMSIEE